MKNQISSELKKRAVAVAVASCLSFAPSLAQAAGLGKITVLSGLGQPLRAELEVNASREEMAGLAARLAPADAFKQAGVDYSSVLYDLRFALEKRPDGKQVVKISSAKPVNEPFLDFLVELNWPTGRLVREYTFLLDPPDVVVKPAGRPVSVVEAKTVQSLPGGTVPVETAPAKQEQQVARKPVVASAQVAASKAVEPVAKPSDSADKRLTRTGDTLGKIAAETMHQGVSLEQMLVGLYQSNPDAFIGKNLNRLRTGAILNIPDKAAVEAIPETEAKKVFHTQSGDWNVYRQKAAVAAAAAPLKDDSASQQAAGKITARVEEKPLPKEQTKDQVKVSRTDQLAKQAAANGMSEEEKIAKEKALKEANERVSILEKNVNELQKLLEMKNQKLAELQQLNAAKPEELKPAATPKEEPKPVELVKPVETAKPVVEESKPQEAVKPVEPPVPAVEPKPVPKPKPVAPPPPPPEPSFVESLLADPLVMAGGGGILALLLGYGLYKRRRGSAGPETTAIGASGAEGSSAFRGNGGQSVDTSNTPPQTGDFSQTGPGTIDTDEVDPVAEADVYMAYGRDAQAEEILLEALQKDPQRIAIHAKLLEIYANRQSLKQFETLASELYAQTAGVGPEWEKVAALGARLDPNNPLYSSASVQAPPAAPAFDAEATMIVSPAKAQSFAKDMSFELPAVAEEIPTAAEKAASAFASTIVQEAPPVIAELPAQEEAADDLAGLDFDLGAAIETPATPELDVPLQIDLPEPVAATENVVEEAPADDALDFDLGFASPAAEPPKPAPEPDVVDFDIEIAEEAPAPDFTPEGTLVMSNPHSLMADQVEDIVLPEVSEPGKVETLVDFELDMGLEEVAPAAEPVAVAEEALPSVPEFDSADVLPEEALSVVADDVDGDSLEFDMKLTDSSVLGQQPAAASFDLGSINLDLAVEEPPAQEMPAPEATHVDSVAPSNAAVDEAAREEISTKLDLAKAYEEMGDLEGARELLSEVAAEGPADLAAEAKEILARIGS